MATAAQHLPSQLLQLLSNLQQTDVMPLLVDENGSEFYTMHIQRSNQIRTTECHVLFYQVSHRAKTNGVITARRRDGQTLFRLTGDTVDLEQLTVTVFVEPEHFDAVIKPDCICKADGTVAYKITNSGGTGEPPGKILHLPEGSNTLSANVTYLHSERPEEKRMRVQFHPISTDPFITIVHTSFALITGIRAFNFRFGLRKMEKLVFNSNTLWSSPLTNSVPDDQPIMFTDSLPFPVLSSDGSAQAKHAFQPFHLLSVAERFEFALISPQNAQPYLYREKIYSSYRVPCEMEVSVTGVMTAHMSGSDWTMLTANNFDDMLGGSQVRAKCGPNSHVVMGVIEGQSLIATAAFVPIYKIKEEFPGGMFDLFKADTLAARVRFLKKEHEVIIQLFGDSTIREKVLLMSFGVKILHSKTRMCTMEGARN